MTDVKERFKAWGSTLYGEIDFKPDEWSNDNPYSPDLEIEHDKTKLKFVDTYTLFGMSLEKLTADTPYPKRKDQEVWRSRPWKWWRGHPNLLFIENENEFWKYAENDVLALEWCVHYWRKWIFERWHIDILRTKNVFGYWSKNSQVKNHRTFRTIHRKRILGQEQQTKGQNRFRSRNERR